MRQLAVFSSPFETQISIKSGSSNTLGVVSVSLW